ncbi:MAG: peptidoglycan-binding domain-containing protein [Thermotaleaceae bacterium]
MRKVVSVLMLVVLLMGFGSGVVDAQSYVFSQRVYKLGMRHNDVKVIQEALKKEGSFKHPNTTTYFGAITEGAVKNFQRKNGLKVDGVVGNATIKKMTDLGLIGANQPQTTSRGAVERRKVGEHLDWWTEVQDIISHGDVLQIEDVDTGKTFKVKVTAGTNHADVETLTKQDTEVMRSIWGGFSWDRRAVLVHKNNRVIAASMVGMPHAGVESLPGGDIVSNRSGGFGKGINYDFVKGNGMDGHVCLHFKNSLTHGSAKSDPQHQANVRKAAGL